MRHVLFVESHGDIIGGGQISLMALMQGLDGARYEASCVCPGEGTMAEAVRQAGVRVHVTAVPPVSVRTTLSAAGCVWRLYRLLRREEISIVHANGSRSMFYAGLAGWLRGVPVVWHVRVTQSDGWWDHVLAVLATRVVVISRAVRQRFTWREPGRPVRLIYNGEDLRKYTLASGREIRRMAGIGEGYLLGMVGRLSEENMKYSMVKKL